MKSASFIAALILMALSHSFAILEGIGVTERPETYYDKMLEQGRNKSASIVDELVKKMPNKAEEICRHNEALWSRDINGAKKAVQYFAKLKAGNLVALALEHPDDEVKEQAAFSLKELGDKMFVPKLVAVLKSSNVVVVGGSEVQVLRNRVIQALVDALSHLTGLDFGEVLAHLRKRKYEWGDYEDIKKIDAVIARCERWLEEQKQKEKEQKK